MLTLANINLIKLVLIRNYWLMYIYYRNQYGNVLILMDITAFVHVYVYAKHGY